MSEMAVPAATEALTTESRLVRTNEPAVLAVGAENSLTVPHRTSGAAACTRIPRTTAAATTDSAIPTRRTRFTSSPDARVVPRRGPRLRGRTPPALELLLPVHRSVGRVDERVDGRLPGRVRNAPGDRRQLVARGERPESNVLGKPPHDPFGGQDRRAGKEHRELVAADPGDEIALADPGLQDFAQFHQRLVAGGAAVLVVQRFEAVRVENCHRQWLPFVPRQF